MRIETITLNETRKVTLTAFLQGTGGEFKNIMKRPAMLILPGGGYQFCSDREADPVAAPYMKAGYQVFILRYSVKEDSVWPNPLHDYDQAMEYIMSKENEWGVYKDKIAIIGFSAGGHLAAAAATMAKNRPAAAILGYAVASADVKGCNESAPDTIPAVDFNTCPCFLFSSRTDTIVPILNSIKFMEALANADVAFESHIYAFGPHGFSTADSSVQSRDTVMCERTPNWVEDSIGWLRDMLGDFGEGCMTEPVCKKHASDDGEAFLSLDCTIGGILKNEKGKELFLNLMNEMEKNKKGKESDVTADFKDLPDIFVKMHLRDVLNFQQVPEEVIESFGRQLNKIENTQQANRGV